MLVFEMGLTLEMFGAQVFLVVVANNWNELDSEVEIVVVGLEIVHAALWLEQVELL